MSTEKHNHRHWDNADRGVYEVWYLTWNHPGTDQGFWLRYITEAPVEGPARAELWFARFDPHAPNRTFAIHKHFPIGEMSSATDPFSLSIAGSRLGHDHANGQLSGGGHDIRWDLRWDPAGQVLRFIPELSYRFKIGETTPLTPNPRVPLSGTLVVDGEKLTFDRATMGQTHLWGTKHAYKWTWGHCNEFIGAPDAVMELLGVRLHRRGMTTPPLFMFSLDLDGEQYRFKEFRHVLRNRASWETGRLTFTARSSNVRVEGELSCAPEDMVNAPYLDPDGTEVFCVNTEIGNARVTVFRRSGLGWREHRHLEAARRAHFEMGGRTRDPAVVREHLLVD